MLNTVWFILVGVLVVGYAVLDGFDLGIGCLYYFLAKQDQERRSLLNALGPVWDANEVWLLTAGGALFAAFPPVYATVFSGFYLAIMLVLFGLIFRAAAIEFRSKNDAPRWLSGFDVLFFLGSFLPALLFGVAMGNVAKGLPLDASAAYTGTFFDLLNPYALVFGLIGLGGFLLQGITYTLMKTEGQVFARARAKAMPVWAVFVVLYLAGTLYSWVVTPYLFNNYWRHPLLILVPALTWAAMFLVPWTVRRAKYGLAFLMSSASFGGMILTLAAGLFPNLVPATNPALSLTVFNAASSQLTLKVMLIIALLGVPIVLFYTAYVYRVFRGKVGAGNSGY